MVHGQRGAVIGAVATFGAIVAGADPVKLADGTIALPFGGQVMILGAFILGPLSAYLLKLFDDAGRGQGQARLRDADRQLQHRHPRRRAWRSSATRSSSPSSAGSPTGSVTASSPWSTTACSRLRRSSSSRPRCCSSTTRSTTACSTPLGAAEVQEHGKSILFMLEANPGPGARAAARLPLLRPAVAASDACPAALIIQFFGGIHEIYFPYVLMRPRTDPRHHRRWCVGYRDLPAVRRRPDRPSGTGQLHRLHGRDSARATTSGSSSESLVCRCGLVHRHRGPVRLRRGTPTTLSGMTDIDADQGRGSRSAATKAQGKVG